MPLSNFTLNVGANAIGAVIDYVQAHATDPGASGTSGLTTAARQPITMGAATGSGDLASTAAVEFTGGAAGAPCAYMSFWDAPAGGNFLGAFPIPQEDDLTFNAEGKYILDTFTLDGQAL